MKRPEKCERENLGRIFYTMIKVNPSFPATHQIGFHYTILIEQVLTLDPVLHTYSVGVIEDGHTLVINSIISVNPYNCCFNIIGFRSTRGLRIIRDVRKEIIKYG